MNNGLNTALQAQFNSSDSRGTGTVSGAETVSRASGVARDAMVVLISPHEGYRAQLKRSLEVEGAKLAAAYELYPGYAQLPALLEHGCDAYIVEIDSDIDVALDLVETICSRKPSATVIVYSALNDPDRLVSSMRAGAREFLTGTLVAGPMRDALGRAAARSSSFSLKRALGKIIVFWSAKGGSGVSTMAANFAIALRAETSEPVLLADLNPQLGDLSVLLSVTSRFTIGDALKSAKRLDSEFLATLVTEHSSGVSVIAAPDVFSPSSPIDEPAVAKFLDLARNQYPWVVIDAGPSLGAGVESVFEMANLIYLITQLDIPSLRSTQLFISYMQAEADPRIEVVVNRFDPRRTEFDDERVAKALGLKPKWKIPNDYAAAHKAANTGNALIHENSPISQSLRQLARSACGKPAQAARKKGGWSLFG